MTLDICHGLALDLQAVAHPHLGHDLVERHLEDSKDDQAQISIYCEVVPTPPPPRAPHQTPKQ